MRCAAMFAILAFSPIVALVAQRGTPPATAQAQAVPLPPATKIEAFVPAAGSITTLGFDKLGKLGSFPFAEVELRELRDAKGAVVRGLLVTVTESQYREESSFVDIDELPELVKGIDAILAINTNATPFQDFQTTYSTRGALSVVAYTNGKSVRYGVRAGRGIFATAPNLESRELLQFRAMVETALSKVAGLAK